MSNVARSIAVFGYGAVGRALTEALTARGDGVRVVQRSAPSNLPKGATFQAAGASDGASIGRACSGVETVVCCTGFPYRSDVWRQQWPALMRALLDGCTASGARFVFADNLYMYGPQTRPLTEDMPLTSYGRKPAIRAEITRLWQRAHEEGRVRAVAVRAADFYGPDCANSVVSAYGVAKFVAGGPALVPYPPDRLHDFTYVPDFARALVSLIDADDDAYGQAWHVPNAPTRTLRDILTRAAELAGVTPRITVLPQPLLPLVGFFNRQVGELVEMRFQWDRPYVVDASKFGARFWADASPFDEGLTATIRSYRAALAAS